MRMPDGCWRAMPEHLVIVLDDQDNRELKIAVDMVLSTLPAREQDIARRIKRTDSGFGNLAKAAKEVQENELRFIPANVILKVAESALAMLRQPERMSILAPYWYLASGREVDC